MRKGLVATVCVLSSVVLIGFFPIRTVGKLRNKATVLTPSSANAELPRFVRDTVTYTPLYSGWVNNVWTRAAND